LFERNPTMQLLDEDKAHALALAANDEAIDEAVRAGRLTPHEGIARKFDDTARIRALVDDAIAAFHARDKGLH
jgi:putative NIF3 family GTP cyclohydrolase 1 type 2